MKTNKITKTIAGLLLAGGMTVGAQATADASTPIDKFIDCNDAFWSIACGQEYPVFETTTLVGPTTYTCTFVPEYVGNEWESYLPPRVECIACNTHTYYRGVAVGTKEVCW